MNQGIGHGLCDRARAFSRDVAPGPEPADSTHAASASPCCCWASQRVTERFLPSSTWRSVLPPAVRDNSRCSDTIGNTRRCSESAQWATGRAAVFLYVNSPLPSLIARRRDSKQCRGSMFSIQRRSPSLRPYGRALCHSFCKHPPPPLATTWRVDESQSFVAYDA